MTVTIYKDDAANAIFVQDNNGAQFMNNLQVIMEDPADTTLHIKDKSKNNYLFYAIPHDHVVDQVGNAYGATPVLACNALNALFSAAGSSNGVAPVITSSTAVSLTGGDTLNYELIATNGVGYEWANLPSGVTTVDGNVRKLIGGSGLTEGTYNITAKAINYFGEDTETIVLTVSAPAFSNTKSLNFLNPNYLGANASAVSSVLGRAANGSGSSDAWSIGMWFKGSTATQGQVILYYGGSDTPNEGHIQVAQVNDSGNKALRFRYGSNNNRIELKTTYGAITPGTWQHILITYDGGTTGAASGSVNAYYGRFNIYIDGVLVSPGTASNINYGWSGSVEADNFRIGRYVSGNYMRDNCRVDEVALWSSDQSGNISDIYNSGSTQDLTALTESPAHYWRMGDGDTYPTIQDNVGSAHFVMYNMTAADIVTDAP